MTGPGPILLRPSDTWNASGAAYHEFAETLISAIHDLVSDLPLPQDAVALDSACGTGTVACALARLGASVIGIDFAPSLVHEAARRAAVAGLASDVQFAVGNVEHLPVRTGALDAVVSNFGFIFAPHHDAVASEAARVLRPGGVLAFTSWTPEEPNLSLMTITSRHVPPPSTESCYGVFDWGCEHHIRDMLSPLFHSLEVRRGNVPWQCSSPSEAIDMLLHRSLGPTMSAFDAASTATRLRIHRDCIALFARCLTDAGTVHMDRYYLLVRGIRRDFG